MSHNWLILGGLAEVDVYIFYRFYDIFYDLELILWRYGEKICKSELFYRAHSARSENFHL